MLSFISFHSFIYYISNATRNNERYKHAVCTDRRSGSKRAGTAEVIATTIESLQQDWNAR